MIHYYYLKRGRWQRRLVAIILNHATTSGCLFLLDSGQIPFVSSPSVHQWLYQYFPGLSILGFHVTSQHMQTRRSPYWCRRSLLANVKMQCFGAWFFKICRFRQNFWKHQKGRKKEDIRNILLSDYVRRLESHVKQRYLEKISLVRINPATLIDAELDPQCLPPIEATDLLCYLVINTSYYTKKQFKAFKSLEAYNQMVSYGLSGTLQQRKLIKIDNLIYVQRESQLTY